MGRPVRVGVIGTGFMGKTHALAWKNVRAVLGDLPEVTLEMLCDIPADKAHALAAQFGFARATDDWAEMVNSPEIDVISITTPNNMHKEMAMAAISAGKHVWCEKPMALTLEDAQEMAEAATARGVITTVGYNYIHNPAFLHARKLIDDGVIGRIVHFRGWVDEDYQADPDLPWTWRAKVSDAGLGALGDMGCHLVSMAFGLCGPIESLIADMQTVHETRPMPSGDGRAKVENEDTATALVHFASGVHGSLSTSRSAWGRKNRLAWEVHGTQGMICFDQERMNELRLFTNDTTPENQGFRTVLTGPAHPPFGQFVPAAGHQLGFNDLKVIEAGELLRAIRDGRQPYPDFSAALAFETVIHSISRAAREGRRVTL